MSAVLHDFRMPTLGADMEKGTMLEWFVAPGDAVQRGQVIAEVDTAKSAIEIEVFEDGEIAEICVQPGEEVPVGTVLARLRPRSAEVPPPAFEVPPPASEVPPPSPVPLGSTHSPVVRHLAQSLGVDLAQVAGTGRHGQVTRADVERAGGARPVLVPASRRPAAAPTPARGVRASPLARRRAAQEGVDLARVRGSGPGGAVTAADVDTAATGRTAAAAPAGAAPASRPTRPLAGAAAGAQMRAAIGALMSRSKREIPHYYLATTIDLHALLTDLHRRNGELPVAERILPGAALLRATALAAAAHPDLNGHFVDGEFHPAPTVRLGTPIALRGGGLVTPVLDAAEQMSLVDLNARLREVASRAKVGRLRASDLGEPTLTVTSLGERGVDAVFGVIYPPQVALVGFGGVVERPWAVDGLVGVRPVVTATLAADHRVSDGHRGALFLDTVAHHLNHPEEL